MKVLQLIDTLRTGGSERMSVNIANMFQEHHIENLLVATRESGPLSTLVNESTKVIVLEKKSSLDLFALLKLIRLSIQFKPSIIHAHSSSLFWAVLIKPFCLNAKIIWHDHYGLSSELTLNARPQVRYLASFINGIISVNDTLKDWSINAMHFATNKIVVINNFPSIKPLHKKVPTVIPTIIHLANFRPQKNQLNLIEALNLLNKEGVKFNCQLIGMEGDGEYLKKCKQLVNDKQLNHHVQFIINKTDIESYLESASIGVLSSDSEGLPVSLLEYGLASLPVICTNVGQCSEVLGDGNFGLLVPKLDPSSMANGIKYIIENPTEYASKAIALNNHIKQKYTSSNFFNQYLKLVSTIS